MTPMWIETMNRLFFEQLIDSAVSWKIDNKADDQRQLQLAFRHDIIFGKRKEIAVFFFSRFLKFHQRL